MDILIGADPELFIKKDGQFVWPTNEMIPGTKQAPHKVEGGAVQVDGAALEFNIDPAATAEQFDTNVANVMAQLEAMLPKGTEFNKGTVTVTVPPDLYASIPKEMREIGCEPDWDAWNERENKPVKETTLGTKRMAGGHIHIGWTEGEDTKDYTHLLSCFSLAKQLDYYVTLPALMWDREQDRKSWYGRAGQFRPKPYGLEYRTPSNWWIWNSETRKMVFEQVTRAFTDLVDKDIDLVKTYGAQVADYIRNSYSSDYFRSYIPELIRQSGVMHGSTFQLPRTDTFGAYREKQAVGSQNLATAASTFR